MSALNKADELNSQVTNYFCAQIAKGINKLEEFSLLVEWRDAIEAAQAVCLAARDWIGLDAMDKMLDECDFWLGENALHA